MKAVSRNFEDFDGTEYNVLAEYGKAIVHMRQQQDGGRFGLVFGAGASTPLNFPNWQDLITRIAAHAMVDGSALLANGKDHTSQSQLLFEHFLTRNSQSSASSMTEADLQAHKMRKEWIGVIRECLYSGVGTDPSALNQDHPYLWSFVPLIKRSRITVNYNFDDTLERLLEHSRDDDKERERSRGFTAIWDSNVLNVPREAVIYHPNGYIPFDLRDRGSDRVVFLEDSFGDQLIASMAGHYSALAAHLEQNTCLFVGLSLQDPTLKHLLRKSASIRSGHFHYFVHWMGDGTTLSKEYKDAVVAANFNTYNLVTLFLQNSEIAALGKLLTAESGSFGHMAQQQGISDRLVFYVTGCVSVGKSTTIDQLRSFVGYGEWTERILPEMRRDPKTLTPEESARVDEWVAEQYRKKNDRLHAIAPGIYVIDRAFLDAFAFTEQEDWSSRANKNRKCLNPAEVRNPSGLRNGHVVLLVGDATAMASRAQSLGKSFDPKAMTRQQDDLLYLYTGLLDQGVTLVDVRGLSISQVARQVAKTVLLGKYVPADLDGGLWKIQRGDIPARAKPMQEAAQSAAS